MYNIQDKFMRDFYGELTEYTGRDRQLVEQRCQTAPIELAWQWEKYKDNPLAFYRESDLYIFDLSMYQNHLEDRGTHEWFRNLIRRYGWKTMLDFGGGIGEYSIIASEEGVEVDFLDIEGSKTLEYAEWRFRKHDVNVKILTEDDGINKNYDFIMLMDVLEHIENPTPVIEQAVKHSKFIFANPDEVQFNFVYPQHISRFDLRSHFNIVDRYLYERKK